MEAEAAYRLGSAYRLVPDHQAARRVSVPALQGQRTLAKALTQLAFADSCISSLNPNAELPSWVATDQSQGRLAGLCQSKRGGAAVLFD